MNNQQIIEYIIKDDIFLPVIGALEYDPDYPNLKANHREFIEQKSRFKEVIPIKDSNILEKIHETQRLYFLKDCAVARFLDESTNHTLSNLISVRHFEIITFFQHNKAYLEELFNIFKDEESDIEKKRDATKFVQQLANIAKLQLVIQRSALFRSLCQNGLYHLFDHSFKDPEQAIRVIGIDVLYLALDADTGLIRSFILSQIKQNKPSLLDHILDALNSDEDPGIRLQSADLLCLLFDPNTSSSDLNSRMRGLPQPNVDNETEDFLIVFYDKYIHRLVEPLAKLSEDTVLLQPTAAEANLLYHICDFLSFAVRNHRYRSKYFILSTDISTKNALLLKSPAQHVRLAALKFFRSCISLKDEFYNRYLIKHNLLEPIVDLLLETGTKSNLINSACLNLFEFIITENLTSLVSHIFHNYSDKLKLIDYTNLYDSYRQKYQQSQNHSDRHQVTDKALSKPQEITPTGPGVWKDSDEDEAYFNNSDNESNESADTTEEDTKSDQPSLNGNIKLVDYEDDLEDDDDPDDLPLPSQSPKRKFEDEETEMDKLSTKTKDTKKSKREVEVTIITKPRTKRLKSV